jgi:hypothetical protein
MHPPSPPVGVGKTVSVETGRRNGQSQNPALTGPSTHDAGRNTPLLAGCHLSGITIGKETEMAKKKGNAGSKKASAATKAKRSSAKAQKTRAAKNSAAVKAVLDAEALRAVDLPASRM